MAVILCYCDESGKKGDHPVVTFSGLCLTYPKLAAFEDAWNTLLRQYEMKALHMARASRLSEKHGPKMPRGQTANQRIDALKPFSDCINQHFELGLIQALDIAGFNSLTKDARAKIGSPDDPYFVAFMRGGGEVLDYAQDDDRVSIICDDDRETAWDCYRHYRGLCTALEKWRDKIISLTFADDRYFPALQAADMVAFLSRLEAKRQFYGTRYDFKGLFDYLTAERGSGRTIWKYLFMTEEKLRSMSGLLEKVGKQ
jgi:hypothetical protein